ncbi:MAG: hypothetical protein ACREU3_12250, partial [Steroidobacteraceae bacterium]
MHHGRRIDLPPPSRSWGTAAACLGLTLLLAACATTPAPSSSPAKPITAAAISARAVSDARAALARGEAEQAWRDLAAAREPRTASAALSFLDLE